MQREEKQLENALDAIMQRISDLKSSLAAMIFKIENEYETINWPTFLDNFALLSGHVNFFYTSHLIGDYCNSLVNIKFFVFS